MFVAIARIAPDCPVLVLFFCKNELMGEFHLRDSGLEPTQPFPHDFCSWYGRRLVI